MTLPGVHWPDLGDQKLLRKHWKELAAVAETLLVRNTLSGKEVVQIIEANQVPDSLEDNIIPRTLAAIRAQALAEIRNKSSNNYLNQPEDAAQAVIDATRPQALSGVLTRKLLGTGHTPCFRGRSPSGRRSA